MAATCDHAWYDYSEDDIVHQVGVINSEDVIPKSRFKLKAKFNCVCCGIDLSHRRGGLVEGLVEGRSSCFTIRDEKHKDGCEFGERLIVQQHRCMERTLDGYRINVNFGLPGYTLDPSFKDKGDTVHVRRSNFAADSALRVYKAAKHVLKDAGDVGLDKLVVAYKDKYHPYPWEDFCINRTSYGRLPDLIREAGDRYRARPFLIVGRAEMPQAAQAYDEKSMLFPFAKKQVELCGRFMNVAIKVRSYNKDLWPSLSWGEPIAFMATPVTSPKSIDFQIERILRDYDYFEGQQDLEIVFAVDKPAQIITADQFIPR